MAERGRGSTCGEGRIEERDCEGERGAESEDGQAFGRVKSQGARSLKCAASPNGLASGDLEAAQRGVRVAALPG